VRFDQKSLFACTGSKSDSSLGGKNAWTKKKGCVEFAVDEVQTVTSQYKHIKPARSGMESATDTSSS